MTARKFNKPLYDALIEGGCSEAKARAAAESVERPRTTEGELRTTFAYGAVLGAFVGVVGTLTMLTNIPT